MQPITILIADDASVIRHTLSRLLSRESDLTVVGEAVNGVEAVRKAVELRPDVVLMDADMPELNGIEATRRIRQLELPSKIIVLTVIDRELFEALSAGASEYLLKDCARESLLNKIRQVAAEGLCRSLGCDGAESVR